MNLQFLCRWLTNLTVCCLTILEQHWRNYETKGKVGLYELTRKLGENHGGLKAVLNWRMWWGGRWLKVDTDSKTRIGQRKASEILPLAPQSLYH